MQIINSNVNLTRASDIIGALQIILRSPAIMPDLETPYSRTTFPNPNHCAIELKDQNISAIITERQIQLDTVLHDIQGLKTVMDSIQTLQQQLVEQKNKIIESINFHKRLVAALWRLPTEVLSKIFCHCLPQIPEPHKFQSPSKLTAPMLLTRICRRWREVAVDIPSLWCGLSVKVSDRNWQEVAFSYDSWLKRTRGRPLSLGLHFLADDHSTKLRRLLQPYINHIASISVDLSHPDCWVGHIFDAPRLTVVTDFLALEEMFLHISDHIPGGDMPASIARTISQLSSTLCSLNVTGWFFSPKNLSSLNPVWAHLTTVNIKVWVPDSVLHLLQLAPNLSSLTIRILFSKIRALPVESFTHAKLRTLHITYECPCDLQRQFSDLLDALSLPTLRVLAVQNVPMWPHEEFKAFLARSKCPLESLIVSGGAATDGQREEYVALVPSLQFLAR